MLGSSQVKDTNSVFGLHDEKNSLTSNDGTLGLASPKEGGAGGQNERIELTGKDKGRGTGRTREKRGKLCDNVKERRTSCTV